MAFLFVWTAVGAAVGYSDTWQLVLNTVASVVNFLLVFLIQYSQNRDTRAGQLKLDELLRSLEQPRTRLVQLEQLSDHELDQLEEEFRELRRPKPKRPYGQMRNRWRDSRLPERRGPRAG